MRIGRANGRLVIIDGDGVVDAAAVSGGEFSADPDRVFAVWDRFAEWAGGYAGPGTHTGPLVPEEKAWSYVAGVMVGQDLSERTVQLAGPVPQFSLGKSFPGFGPTGPWLMTPDELPDRDDLRLRCSVDGRVLQDGRTKDMIFSVPELVARISAVCPMRPGDLIFTGTPSGVGMGRQPPEFLRPGTTLVSTIEGLGELRNALVAGPGFPRPGR